MRLFRTVPPAAVSVVAVGFLTFSALGGCSVMSHLMPGSKASTEKSTASADQVDVRRYLGPNYCPELRIFEGAQLIRTYQRGHQGDQDYVTWQASFGKTARDCLYDAQGNLTIKVGVAGRVVAGPKAGTDPVSVPIKIAVLKFKDSVLATERFPLSITIPAQGSTVFSEVKEITVPSPGNERNYLIYVGFDVGNWDPMHPTGQAIAAVDEPPAPAAPPPPAAAAPPPPPARAAPAKPTPNELPVPAGGFVLGQ